MPYENLYIAISICNGILLLKYWTLFIRISTIYNLKVIYNIFLCVNTSSDRITHCGPPSVYSSKRHSCEYRSDFNKETKMLTISEELGCVYGHLYYDYTMSVHGVKTD